MSDVNVVEWLNGYIDDPMWADHAEVSKVFLSKVRDRIEAQSAELSRLTRENEALRDAARPFVAFATNMTDESRLSNIHREPVSEWFGPSDFRRLATAAKEG